MAKSKIVKLERPVKIGAEIVAEVEWRPMTIGDQEDALQEAIKLKRGANPLTLELCSFARILRKPVEKLRGMDPADYNVLRDALTRVEAGDEAEETEEEEASQDPTMPDAG